MATFKKIGTKWRAEVCVAGKRASKTLPTKAEVKSWAALKEAELGKLSQGVSTTHTLGDVFVRYADEISSLKKGAQWEIVRLKMFARFAIASVKLINLRREDLEQYILVRSKDVKSSSVNRELNLISHCLTQARRWRLMEHNPMDDLKRPKNPPNRERRISPEEVARVLVAHSYSEEHPVTLQRQRAALAFLFALETAMRAGEICSLLAKHIDTTAKTAFLPDTKTGVPRYVPLSTEALRLINRLQPWPDDVPLFGIKPSVLSSTFGQGVERAGIQNLTFHDSRHEGIRRLAKKLSVLDLARTVGHSDIKELMTYYNESAEEIAKLLD